MRSVEIILTTLAGLIILHSPLTHAGTSGNTTAPTPGAIYSPFNIHIDPMEGLLLITFLGDADTLYTGLEPQLFNDTINGTGMLIIAWRVDGFVDVYHQPSLSLNPAKYDIAGKGLANMITRDMEGAYYNVNEQGVQAWFEFTDIHNRKIEVHIAEKNPASRKPFGLLAPMGDAAESPSSMPMVILHDFYLVRKKHTDYSIKIDGRMHTPDNFPMRMDRKKMYFTRYSMDPMIATLNPAHSGPLSGLQSAGNNTASLGNTSLALETINNRQYIKSLQVENKNHALSMHFEPSVPNIAEFAVGESYRGKFVIEGHRNIGKIKGRYSMINHQGTIKVELNPSGGWKPRPDRFSLRVLYTVAGVFKKWPKSYFWNAEITFDDADLPYMESSWERR
jgi:hypothetical protein